jgi:hypothetical protein
LAFLFASQVAIAAASAQGIRSLQRKPLQQEQPLLVARVPRLVLGSATPVQQGSQLLLTMGLPSGIVSTRRCTPDAVSRDFAAGGLTVRSALHGIFAGADAVQIREHAGVINVTSGQGQPAMLEAGMPNFDFENGRLISPSASSLPPLLARWSRDRKLIPSAAILNLPQISAAARAERLEELPPPSFETLSSRTKITIRFQGGSLRELLNAAVRAAGRGLWVYTQRICGEQRKFSLSLTGF